MIDRRIWFSLAFTFNCKLHRRPSYKEIKKMFWLIIQSNLLGWRHRSLRLIYGGFRKKSFSPMLLLANLKHVVLIKDDTKHQSVDWMANQSQKNLSQTRICNMRCSLSSFDKDHCLPYRLHQYNSVPYCLFIYLPLCTKFNDFFNLWVSVFAFGSRIW